MSAISPEVTVLRVSTDRNETITLQLEGDRAVTVRLEVDSKCGCHAAPSSRAGSYIDRDVTTPA